MNPIIKQFSEFIIKNNFSTKEIAIKKTLENFNLIKDGKIYHNDFFATRFCFSKNGNFSNTILALSKLQKYDKIPILIVLIVANGENKIFLGNSTFLSKISHSSKELRENNIKGSFNGSDIIKIYNNIENSYENIEDLFAFHTDISWNENLSRLVEATSGIIGKMTKFIPNENELHNIFHSIDRAIDFINSENYNILLQDLNQRVESCKDAILVASRIENINIRGRLIEALITLDKDQRNELLKNIQDIEINLPVYDSKNGLGDYVKTFDNQKTLTDIKTKIIYLNSNPKAFNIDKFLQTMAEDNTIFMFYFIGIDEKGIFNSILTSVFHNMLIDATTFQHHWSGRNTRGATQFIGKQINSLLSEEEFKNQIDKNKSKKFLEFFLEM